MADEEKDGILGVPFTGIEGETAVEEQVEQVEETTPEPTETTEEAPAEQVEAEPTETEPVEAAPDTETKVFEKEEEVEPEEPIEEKPADKLAKFRKEQALDEEAVAAELESREQQAAAATQYNTMLKESPKLQLAYLETLDEKGMLNEEWRPHLEKLRESIAPKKQPTEPEVKQEEKLPTVEEARSHAKKLISEGKEDEAIEYLADVKAKHKAVELRKEIEPLKAELDAWKQDKTKQEKLQLQRQTAEAVTADLSAACRMFPKLMALDPKTGRVQWKCKKTLEAVSEVYKDWQNPNSENYRPNVSSTTIVREALIRTGRLKPGVAKKEEPKKPQAKPIHATTTTGAMKQAPAKKSEPGIFGVKFR